jgi:dihydroflavonol-4-reductase
VPQARHRTIARRDYSKRPPVSKRRLAKTDPIVFGILYAQTAWTARRRGGIGKPMRALVTGATGFLGSWVTRELVRSGCKVRILARPQSRLGDLEQMNVDVLHGDIMSPDSLAAATAEVDAIVHCAGLVSLNLRDRDALQRTNVAGTRNVLSAAASRGVRVLHTSSIATIGPTSDPRPLDESAPAVPLPFDYPYAASKRESEALALDYGERGLDVVVLNPGIVLGPGDVNYRSTQFVLRYLRRELWLYLPGGASFADVRDVAAAYVAALERGRKGQRYVLAGVNRTYRALQEELQRLTGLHRSAPMPQPVAEWFALWSQAGSVLGQHPFEEFNTSVVRWASLFNYCSAQKAETELGYRARDFSLTLTDTVVDHLRRGAAQAATIELKALLKRAEAPRSSVSS